MTRDHAWHADPAARLLAALRNAGCQIFIDPEDGQLLISPPSVGRVEWDDGDVQEAIDEQYWDLLALVHDEARITVH